MSFTVVENNMLDQKEKERKKIVTHLPELETSLVSAGKQSFAIVVVVVVNGNDNSPAVLALVLALTSFTVEILLLVRIFFSNFSSLVNCLSLASWEGSAEGEASEGSLPLGSMTASAVRFFKRMEKRRERGKRKRERRTERARKKMKNKIVRENKKKRIENMLEVSNKIC